MCVSALHVRLHGFIPTRGMLSRPTGIRRTALQYRQLRTVKCAYCGCLKLLRSAPRLMWPTIRSSAAFAPARYFLAPVSPKSSSPRNLATARPRRGKRWRRLVSENFVRVIPRSGYQVTTLTLRDFEEVFAVSRLVWPPMMALAAERSSLEDIQRLRAKANREANNWIEEAHLVLQAAANATGNQRLADISMRLYDEMERFFSLALRFQPLPPRNWSWKRGYSMPSSDAIPLRFPGAFLSSSNRCIETTWRSCGPYRRFSNRRSSKVVRSCQVSCPHSQ